MAWTFFIYWQNNTEEVKVEASETNNFLELYWLIHLPESENPKTDTRESPTTAVLPPRSDITFCLVGVSTSAGVPTPPPVFLWLRYRSLAVLFVLPFRSNQYYEQNEKFYYWLLRNKLVFIHSCVPSITFFHAAVFLGGPSSFKASESFAHPFS